MVSVARRARCGEAASADMLEFSMSNGEDHAWDFLSGSEAEAVDGARDELRGQAWAQPLLRDIPATADLMRADKARLLELRFARALHRAGIAPRYEIVGEGGSTLDFGFTNGDKEWRVELTRLEETEAARSATVIRRIETVSAGSAVSSPRTLVTAGNRKKARR